MAGTKKFTEAGTGGGITSGDIDLVYGETAATVGTFEAVQSTNKSLHTRDGVWQAESFLAVPHDATLTPVPHTVLTGGSAPFLMLFTYNADDSDDAADRFITTSQDVIPVIPGEPHGIPSAETITRVDFLGMAVTATAPPAATGVIVVGDTVANAKTALDFAGPLLFDSADAIKKLIVTAVVHNTVDVIVMVEGYS